MSDKPTKDQRNAIADMLHFLDDGSKTFYLLNGPAGTGKTFAMTKFIRTQIAKAKLLKRAPPRVFLAAPTHKAVGVIADLMEEDSLQVQSGTIHSLLGLYLTANGEEKSLADGGLHRLAEYTLVIIDEGSMIGDRLFNILKNKLAEAGRRAPKVLFLGDSYQLDPVKESASPVFGFEGTTLTEQMRQVEGNAIGELIALSREYVDKAVPMPAAKEALDEEGNGVHVITGSDFSDAVLDTFDTREYADDPNYCRVVAWTNRTVDRYNKLIRNRLIGKDAEQIVVGEVLVMQTPALDEEGNIILHTEQMVTVTDLSTDSIVEDHYDFGSKSFKVWVVYGRSKDGMFVSFDVLHEDSREDYEDFANKFRKAAIKNPSRWREYWAFVDQFARVCPPYACTVHKAQGSSFTNVFVVLTDIVKNRKVKERNKLLYVALSRARKNIVLNTSRMD